jgi:hypothetical protein
MSSNEKDLKWKYKIDLLCYLLTKIKHVDWIKNIYSKDILSIVDYHDKYNLYHDGKLIGYIGFNIIGFEEDKPHFSKDLFVKGITTAPEKDTNKKLKDYIYDDVTELPINIDAVIKSLLYSNVFTNVVFTKKNFEDFHRENGYMDLYDNYFLKLLETVK